MLRQPLWLQGTQVDPTGPAPACVPHAHPHKRHDRICHVTLGYASPCLTCLIWSIVPCRCSASGFMMNRKGLAL